MLWKFPFVRWHQMNMTVLVQLLSWDTCLSSGWQRTALMQKHCNSNHIVLFPGTNDKKSHIFVYPWEVTLGQISWCEADCLHLIFSSSRCLELPWLFLLGKKCKLFPCVDIQTRSFLPKIHWDTNVLGNLLVVTLLMDDIRDLCSNPSPLLSFELDSSCDLV